MIETESKILARFGGENPNSITNAMKLVRELTGLEIQIPPLVGAAVLVVNHGMEEYDQAWVDELVAKIKGGK